jgi:hypothetical protein
MSWTAIESAVQNWVEGATGLDDAHVIFAEQNAATPAGDFITIRLGDTVALGAYDRVEVIHRPENPPGEEVELTSHGCRELTVSIQAFTVETHGDASGRALLSKVRNALALPAVREALRAVGLAPFDSGSVRNITALVDTDFQGRAIFEARFNLTESAVERTTFIETVELVDLTGDDALSTS